MGDVTYCADQVAQADPDRFATIMLADPASRADLLALYAFNSEVAKIRESVREPMLGEIRLQWWRDAVTACAQSRHQILRPLALAIRRHDLPMSLFEEILTARSRDFDTLPPEDDATLSSYVDATGGALMDLSARCLLCNERDSGEVSQAARAAGRAWAWIGLARAAPELAQIQRQLIPLARGGREVQAALTKGDASSTVRSWVEFLVDRGLADLAILQQQPLARSFRPISALGKITDLYAQQIRRSGFDPFDERCRRLNRLKRFWALATA